MLDIVEATKHFGLGGGRVVVALGGVDLTVARGEFVILLGPNGSGKSTLLDAITGDVALDKGDIRFDGRVITSLQPYLRAPYVTRVYQSRESAIPRALRIAEVIRLAAERAPEYAGKRVRRGDVERILDETRPGLSHHAEEQVWHLSGGEHQLLCLTVARLLAMGQPEGGHVVLLDEHVSQLDPESREMVMAATNRIVRGANVGALMATHDFEIAARFGDRQVMLCAGRVVDDRRGADRFTSASALRKRLAEVARRPDEGRAEKDLGGRKIARPPREASSERSEGRGRVDGSGVGDREGDI